MSSVAEIWNMALGLVGVDGEINNPETETSASARACRRYWETVRDEVLRDFDWPNLKTTEDLTLVETSPNSGVEWAFSYAKPANCLKIRRLLNGASALDTNSNVTRYVQGRKASDGSALIFTNLEDAQIEYTFHETETARYEPDLVSALACRLASAIAAHFGPEAVKLGDRAFQYYRWRIANAWSNALREERPERDDSSDFERARG